MSEHSLPPVPRSPTGTCISFGDGFDGYVIHGESCPNVERPWMSGPDCINYAINAGPVPDWAKR